MAHSSRKSSGGLPTMIERQMRNWSLLREQGAKNISTGPACQKLRFYITLSRESGCGTDPIVEKLAERTGFQKFDREILDYMVKRDDVRRRLYETLDNHTLGWIEGICSSLSFGPTVDETGYFLRLSRAVLAVCLNTHAIIVGRGANFILPRQCGLAVRLVAPYDYRLETFAKRMDLDHNTARDQMELIDQNRSQFIENHFGKYAYDPRRYDLVVNVSRFSPDTVVDIIVTALQVRAGKNLKLPVSGSPAE
ncbi:MAG: cytidylate kinase-like family protein [Phycisphaerae bacterium]